MRYTSTRQFELPSAPAVRPRPWWPVAVAATWLALPLAVMLTFWPGAAAAQDCSGGDTPLLAGQFIDIGCVKISNDESELHITYVVDEPDWCMTKTHLHVADDPDAIPQSGSRNPIPGRFDYRNDHEPCVTRFGVDIELGDWTAGSLLYIAAQAAVEDTLTGERQTAWGDGSRFQGTNWATYTTYEVQGLSCPCDALTVDGVSGADLLVQMCPNGEPGDTEYTDERSVLSLVDSTAETSYTVVYGGKVESFSCTLHKGGHDVHATISQDEADECYMDVTTACGSPPPDPDPRAHPLP